tara:strand:- start:1635 stop:2816 length:1182 start_codon:yes stop_codon:yes gene_type:complete
VTSPPLSGLSCVIVGAGIGGLTAALALKARGADVMVCEQAPEIAEVGAGLQVSPNGGAVLRALGLAPALEQAAVRASAVILRDYRRLGDVLRMDLPTGDDGHVYGLVHRADLIALLADAARARDIPIQLGRKVSHARPGDRPQLHFDDGDRLHPDLVIGADGVHAATRAALNGPAEPRFTGHIAWRATVPCNAPDDSTVALYMGPGRHLVRYPLRGGRLMNIVAVEERRTWTAEGWHHGDDPENLRRAFARFRGEVPALLDRVENVNLWGLFRHPVADSWTGPGMAILGDAAHPTLPFLAQGANLAMEDAWVLARALAEAPGAMEHRLSAYQQARRPRAEKVITASTRNAWKYHVRFPPARLIGHTGLKVLGRIAPDRMSRQYDWIHAHDVTA